MESHTGSRTLLTGLHLLLTYKCDSECDHCFLWCGPEAKGTMSIRQVEEILRQARAIQTVNDIYFEGGEPFLFYPVLARGVELARAYGYDVGIVTNAYWATDRDDAVFWLRQLAKMGIADLSISTDEFHGDVESQKNARRAGNAAKSLGIPVAILGIRGIDRYGRASLNDGMGNLYFRGRAASNLASKVKKRSWELFAECPEKPPNIERVHIDCYGNVQFCQGITIGNIRRKPLKRIMEDLVPESHPIIGPLIRGGPAALAKEHHVRPSRRYADECHLCYETRRALRRRGKLKATLTPNQAYGED